MSANTMEFAVLERTRLGYSFETEQNVVNFSTSFATILNQLNGEGWGMMSTVEKQIIFKRPQQSIEKDIVTLPEQKYWYFIKEQSIPLNILACFYNTASYGEEKMKKYNGIRVRLSEEFDSRQDIVEYVMETGALKDEMINNLAFLATGNEDKF